MKMENEREKTFRLWQLLFILLFVGSLAAPPLFYPLLKNRLDTENYENRALAEFPELSAENFWNLPSELEAYYNDHAPFKNILVKLKTRFDLATLGDKAIGSVTVGKENWMFYTVEEDGENALADYQHTNVYQAEEKERLREQIAAAESLAEEKGFRFYLFEAPNKESLYGQYMPDSIDVYGETSRLDDVLPWLSEECALPVYSLKEAMARYADRYQLYYKYDTHWNLLGSFVASQEIARVTTGTAVWPEEVTISEGAPCSGDLARMLNLADIYNDDIQPFVEDYLPEVTANCIYNDGTDSFEIYESDAPGGRTLFLIGDSYSQYTKKYLPKVYSRCVFVTFDYYRPEMLDEYPADDLVYLTVERNQQRFENPYDILKNGLGELES